MHFPLWTTVSITYSHFSIDFLFFCIYCLVCPQANEYSLPSLNAGLEDVKPSLSTSASSDLASSVSQSYSVVTGTIWLTLHCSLTEPTQLQSVKDVCSRVVRAAVFSQNCFMRRPRPLKFFRKPKIPNKLVAIFCPVFTLYYQPSKLANFEYC